MGLTPLQMTGEKSDPKVVKEVADLMLMMDNWKKGFRTWCTEGEDNEWVYREFWDDITTHLQPYVYSLAIHRHINYYGGQCLMMFAFDKVAELRDEFGG